MMPMPRIPDSSAKVLKLGDKHREKHSRCCCLQRKRRFIIICNLIRLSVPCNRLVVLFYLGTDCKYVTHCVCIIYLSKFTEHNNNDIGLSLKQSLSHFELLYFLVVIESWFVFICLYSTLH